MFRKSSRDLFCSCHKDVGVQMIATNLVQNK